MYYYQKNSAIHGSAITLKQSALITQQLAFCATKIVLTHQSMYSTRPQELWYLCLYGVMA